MSFLVYLVFYFTGFITMFVLAMRYLEMKSEQNQSKEQFEDNILLSFVMAIFWMVILPGICILQVALFVYVIVNLKGNFWKRIKQTFNAIFTKEVVISKDRIKTSERDLQPYYDPEHK